MSSINDFVTENNIITEKYIEESDKLFAEWKNSSTSDGVNHKDNVFIRDGVVEPEKWFSQSERPLFLLKEAHGGDADWDLIKGHLLKEEKMSKMWQRITHYSDSIFCSDKEPREYSKSDSKKHQKYNNEALKKIAVVNIKKSNGNKESEYKDIERYVKADKAFLRREIELCDPTVIICGCYTASFLNTIMEKKISDKNNINDNLFYHFELNGHDVIVLDFWHPANQYPDIMNYYTLKSIYEFAKADQKKRLCEK